jgi:hypothetical protein
MECDDRGLREDLISNYHIMFVRTNSKEPNSSSIPIYTLRLRLLLSRHHHQGLVRVFKQALALIDPNSPITLSYDGFDVLGDLCLLVRGEDGNVTLAQCAFSSYSL